MKYYAASFIGTQYAIGRFYKLALTDCETIFFLGQLACSFSRIALYTSSLTSKLTSKESRISQS